MPAKAHSASGKEEFTLASLAFRLEPLAYEEWKRELAERREGASNSSFPSWGRRDYAMYLTDVRYGTEFSQMAKDQRRFNDLVERLHTAVYGVIASPSARTQGIRPDGTLGDVPRAIARQLKIDFENNTLSTPDGGVVWRAIVVHAAVAGSGTTSSPPRGNATDDEMADWMQAHRQTLAAASRRRGRDVVLADAAQHFQVPRKVVLGIWINHKLGRKPFHPSA
jgi:hypothetical protein